MIIIPQIIIDKIKQEALTNLPKIQNEDNYKQYVIKCSYFHAITGTVIIYTLDNLHKSLKHPSLRYALHLSLAFRHPIRHIISPITSWEFAKRVYNNIPIVPFDWYMAVDWVRLFLPRDKLRWQEGNGISDSNYPEPVNFYTFTDANWHPYNELPSEAEYELLNDYLLQIWQY